jgi:hypothetical protein
LPKNGNIEHRTSNIEHRMKTKRESCPDSFHQIGSSARCKPRRGGDAAPYLWRFAKIFSTPGRSATGTTIADQHSISD